MLDAAELYTNGGDIAHARVMLEPLLPELPHGPLRARALFRLAYASADWDAAAAMPSKLQRMRGRLTIACAYLHSRDDDAM